MRTIKQLLLITVIITSTSACKKTYEEPPENQLPIGNVITIADLKELHNGQNMLIETNYTIFVNVTTEETNGNFYKEAFIQDSTSGIKVAFKQGSGLYIGDSIQLNIMGAKLTKDYNFFQLEDVDPYLQVKKLSTNKLITPDTIDILNLNWNDYQGSLVCFNNVEFSGCEIGKTYADAFNLEDDDRYLIDEDGNTIAIKTSGYANFADTKVDSGNGSIVCVVGETYGSTIKFHIRDIEEVKFHNQRITPIAFLCKDFDDASLTSEGWGSFWSGTTTSKNWGEWEIFGDNVASAGNFDVSIFQNYACESWLVSPNVDLSGTNAPYLTFDNVVQYTPGPQPNDGLELLISSDYDGTSDPTQQGNWTNITSYVPNWDVDSGDWTFVSSGNIDLTSFIAPTVSIAFKYTGTNNDGATWEIDNILITE